jgi:hypothetical protein
MGHVKLDLASQQGQAGEENGSAGYAVHVVIAVDADETPGPHRSQQAIHGIVHAVKQFGLVQSGQRSGQEAAGLLGLGYPAIQQELRDEGRDAKVARQAVDGRNIMRQEVPDLRTGRHGGSFLLMAVPITIFLTGRRFVNFCPALLCS